MGEYDTLSGESVFVNVEHKNLAAPLTGYAMRGISTTGTEGMLIFIPTKKFEAIRDLIRVVE